MFKKLLITTAILTPIAAIAYSVIAVPMLGQKHANALISSFNFESFNAESQSSSPSAINYENIVFDGDDKINTATSLSIGLKPFDVLNGKTNSLTLTGLDVIGSLDDDYTVYLDGIDMEQLRSAILSSNAQTVRLDDFDVSLITPHYGALTVTGDITAQRSEDGHYDFVGNFDSRQKFISLTGNISGTIGTDHFSADLEVLRGKMGILSHTAALTRMSGTMKINYDKDGLNITSEFIAGSFKMARLQWQNASATFNYKNNTPNVSLSATSVGFDGAELSLSYKDQQTSGTIYTETPQRRDAYIAAHKIAGDPLITKLLRSNLVFEKTPEGLTFTSVPANNSRAPEARIGQ